MKRAEVVPVDPRLDAMEQYDTAVAEYNAGIPACPDCGGRPGYNPITGVHLKEGHAYNCLTMVKRRAEVK